MQARFKCNSAGSMQESQERFKGRRNNKQHVSKDSKQYRFGRTGERLRELCSSFFLAYLYGPPIRFRAPQRQLKSWMSGLVSCRVQQTTFCCLFTEMLSIGMIVGKNQVIVI